MRAGIALLVAPAFAMPVAAQPPVAAPVPAVASVADNDAALRHFRLDGALAQGSILRGTAPAFVREVRLDGVAVPLAPDGRFLIAFDRDAPASSVLGEVAADGRVRDWPLAIAPGNWRVESVNAPFTGSATSEEFQLRRAAEVERIAAARQIRPVSEGWRQHFIWPVQSRITGRFGSQRIYQGVPGSYHGGVDLAGATGTPFVAPADGVVILAAADPFTLEGHLLMIDHGMGLSSAFLHCSRLNVKEGDVVRQGQVLGAIGATGRASGPHLHWGMRWNNARMDPLPLVGR